MTQKLNLDAAGRCLIPRRPATTTLPGQDVGNDWITYQLLGLDGGGPGKAPLGH